VLRLVREGLSNEEIARRLGISVDGAKFHVSEILGKLGVSTRAEAARWDVEREREASRPTARLRFGHPNLHGGHRKHGRSEGRTGRLYGCRRIRIVRGVVVASAEIARERVR
jgi:hypothetical protein